MRIDDDDVFAGLHQQVHDRAADAPTAAHDDVTVRADAAQALLGRPRFGACRLRAANAGAGIGRSAIVRSAPKAI